VLVIGLLVVIDDEPAIPVASTIECGVVVPSSPESSGNCPCGLSALYV
jgi:hypothetical protein